MCNPIPLRACNRVLLQKQNIKLKRSNLNYIKTVMFPRIRNVKRKIPKSSLCLQPHSLYLSYPVLKPLIADRYLPIQKIVTTLLNNPWPLGLGCVETFRANIFKALEVLPILEIILIFGETSTLVSVVQRKDFLLGIVQSSDDSGAHPRPSILSSKLEKPILVA